MKEEVETRFAEASGRFTKEVKRRMDRRQVSGAELARRMEITRAAVSRIFKPGSNPTLRTMVEVAYALGSEIEVTLRRPSPLSAMAPDLTLAVKPSRERR